MESPPDISLKSLFASRGIRPKRRLGQNFMVDRNMLDFFVRQADLSTADVVLEVGAGLGFLTERLAAAAGRVVAVEIDSGLFEIASERLSDFRNLEIIECDALDGGRWNAPVRESLGRALSACPDAPLKLVANLPYSAATAVVQAALLDEIRFAGCWFTCQKEVAERLTASAGTPEYGYISVIMALLAEVRVIRRLPPTVFWPQPKVDSCIVEVLPSAAKSLAVAPAALAEGVSKLFSARRKQVLKVLKRLNLDENDIIKVRKMLSEHGLAPNERVFRLLPPLVREIVVKVLS